MHRLEAIMHDGFIDHHKPRLKGEIDMPVTFWGVLTKGWIQNQGLDKWPTP